MARGLRSYFGDRYDRGRPGGWPCVSTLSRVTAFVWPLQRGVAQGKKAAKAAVQRPRKRQAAGEEEKVEEKFELGQLPFVTSA